jgi:hypothetical protein
MMSGLLSTTTSGVSPPVCARSPSIMSAIISRSLASARTSGIETTCKTTSGRYLTIASPSARVASGVGAPPGGEVSKMPRESTTCQVAKRSGKLIR